LTAQHEVNLGGANKLSWTDERVELLKKLWTEGLSASQIAGRLGNGVTRNAVIGKVHRLNLSGRVQQQRVAQPRQPRKQREPSLAPRAGGSMPSMPTAGSSALKPMMRAETHIRPATIPEPQPLRLVDLSKDGRVTILHLSDKTCKWPIGDPGSEEFCFCGHGPREGSPYCEYHARLAYQPMQDRRNRKVNFG
jgi:GcrA cell cycle regulator